MPAETTTYSYTCTNVNGSYTAHATLTVTGANGPNLTAGTVSPQTADPGTPQNFTGTVTNIGNAPTGTGFNDLWQRADSWDGTTATNVQNLGVVAMNALDASGGTHDHDTATLSEYSFPSSDAGTTRYLRLCADEDASGNGTITETNETDNCGGWTPVNVSGSQESPSVSCTPNPTDVQVGDTVVWTPSAAGFTGTPSYSWTTVGGGSPSSGNGSTFSDSYSAAGNYTVNVVATAGSQTANNSCTPAVTVEPTGGGGPPTATITASPLRLASGLTTDLEWTATNIATSCTVTGTDGYTKTDTPDPNGNVADGDPAHLITGQTKFTVSCDSGAATASVIVNVLPGFQEF
jgi:plastocyanin